MHMKAMSTGVSLARSCASVTSSARTGTENCATSLAWVRPRPCFDDRHLLARLHHMGANIPANGTRSDNSYLPTHAFLPAFLAAEASAPAGLIATVEPRRARHQASRWGNGP